MNLHPEEPVFILRAADIFAPAVITDWCNKVIHDPNATQANFDQATQAWLIAKKMLEWQQANPHLVKIPDLNEPRIKAA